MGMGKTVRASVEEMYGQGAGQGMYVPVQAPHVCRCAARTGNIRGPLGCPSSLLWAVLGLSLPCPYPARTGPVRACLLGIQIDASKD